MFNKTSHYNQFDPRILKHNVRTPLGLPVTEGKQATQAMKEAAIVLCVCMCRTEQFVIEFARVV